MPIPFPNLPGKAILAPLSGVGDVAFRELCKNYGASLSFTEFVSSAGITRTKKEFRQLKRESKGFCGVQLFGSSIEEVVSAAKLVEKKFDIIDINCGCPAYKVISTGSGSALLEKPEKIGEIIKKLAAAVSIPVTVKLRSGIDKNNINAVKVAKIAEKAGASAITLHARTQKQGYSGKSDWELIKKVKESVNIPVIGNGDIDTPEIFAQRLEESGADHIMIGRAAMANPYIFRQINDYVKKGSYGSKPKLGQLNDYLKIAKKYSTGFVPVKQHAIQFTKGLVGGSVLRNRISLCKNLDELKVVLKNFKDQSNLG